MKVVTTLKSCKLTLLWILFLLFGLDLYSQNIPIDVYLIGGQSNATGQGYIANMPTDFVAYTSVMIFHSHLLKGKDPYTWQPLYQASETPDKFGVELSLGTRLQEQYPQKKIALIKHAYSGSNLYEDWHPGKNKRDTANFGKQFRYFVQTVEEGLAELRNQGYSPKIRAMLWQKGEGDARDIAGMENAENYGQNLNHFIKRVRQQFGARKMPFIYGYVIPVARDRFTGREEVREGQTKVDQGSGDKLALSNAFVIHTDDLPLRSEEPNSPYPDDQVHFNTFGILELGKRFASKIYEVQN
jgi:hypothetical protein